MIIMVEDMTGCHHNWNVYTTIIYSPVHYTFDLTTASTDSEYNHIHVHHAIYGNTLSEEGVSTTSTRRQHAIHGSTLSEEHVSNAATRRQHAIQGARYTTALKKVFARRRYGRNNK